MDEYILISIFVLITGACVGSFLNVVALRAITKESIVFPSSKCPKCNTPIKWYDNIPILSYFLTIKGKCRSCGEKVSIQYPIVEAITAILFLGVVIAFDFTLKTVLLLILLSIAIVISITDIKKEYVYDVHSWIFIITALIYSVYANDVNFACVGFISGALIMEIIARASYYLVKKDSVKDAAEIDENEKTEDSSEENIDINEYINKNKRAFGEGDTYLAAGVGALLGIKYFVAAIFLAIILQAICILPQFLMNLYKQKETRLLTSLLSFIVISSVYFIISNIVKLNIFIVLAFVLFLIFFAIDSITRLKSITNNTGFHSIPFGPALLFSGFLMLFFGSYIVHFLKQHVFLILG